MNTVELNYDWERERRMRIAHRRQMFWAKWLSIAVYVGLTIMAVAAIARLAYVHVNKERLERAAYNEGFYGVDRAEALRMADAGIGKSAEELLAEVRK